MYPLIPANPDEFKCKSITQFSPFIQAWNQIKIWLSPFSKQCPFLSPGWNLQFRFLLLDFRSLISLFIRVL